MGQTFPRRNACVSRGIKLKPVLTVRIPRLAAHCWNTNNDRSAWFKKALCMCKRLPNVMHVFKGVIEKDQIEFFVYVLNICALKPKTLHPFLCCQKWINANREALVCETEYKWQYTRSSSHIKNPLANQPCMRSTYWEKDWRECAHFSNWRVSRDKPKKQSVSFERGPCHRCCEKSRQETIEGFCRVNWKAVVIVGIQLGIARDFFGQIHTPALFAFSVAKTLSDTKHRLIDEVFRTLIRNKRTTYQTLHR